MGEKMNSPATVYITKYITFHVEKGKPEPDVFMWDDPPNISYYVIRIPVPYHLSVGNQGEISVKVEEEKL
jgi:hypothetical protein